jgi:hypothetical protein
MKPREYEITIGPSGEVEVHVDGFKGRGCLDAIRFFEQVVGETRDLRHTSGFYEPEEDVRIHGEQRT